MLVSTIKIFRTEEDEKLLIDSSEAKFAAGMALACEKIASSHCRAVLLSGPSCSGKTTAARLICDHLRKKGRNIKEISLDDFFFDRNELIKRAMELNVPVDLDSVKTIDLPYMSECINGIYSGKSVRLPKYDFYSGKRGELEEYTPEGDFVVLFEGIQAVYPEVRALFGNIDFISIFIMPFTELSVNGELFTARDLRFCRRLVRDFRERDSTPENTFVNWKGVTDNEDENILPYASGCDIMIDSTFEYEPYMIKNETLRLLSMIGKNSAFRKNADALALKFASVPSLGTDHLPDDSCFREFIGRR